MFDSKSPIVKIVGYIIIGFFVVIIVIAFGVPDFISRAGRDKNIIAVVNGQKVHRYDYYSFKRMVVQNMQNSPYGQAMLNMKNLDDYILNMYIRRLLLLQKAREMGFTVSDARVGEDMRRYFTDPRTGKFDSKRFNQEFDERQMSFRKYHRDIKEQILMDTLETSINMGMAVPSDDVFTEHLSRNSTIQIKYSFASNADLKNRFVARIFVTDQDVTEEMRKNKAELKDPKTDRKRIKDKLENRKLKDLKKELVEQINQLALKKAPFQQTSALLQGKQGISKPFKIGENLTDAAGKPLTQIGNSLIFLEECLSLKEMQTSRVIETPAGLYIFTPMKKDLALEKPDEEKFKLLQRNLQYERYQAILSQLVQKLWEEAEITKNLKTN